MTNFKYILIMTFFLIGCADSNFEASSGTQKLSADKSGGNDEDAEFGAGGGDGSENFGSGNGTGLGNDNDQEDIGRLTVENNDLEFCSKTEATTITVNLSGDDTKGVHILESQAFKFNIASSDGNVLNVTKYTQDDIAMIVPAKYSASDIQTSFRNYHIPKSGFLLFDPVNGIKGSVNSDHPTTYNFDDHPSKYIRGGGDTTVQALGMPMVNQNDIKLSSFDNDEYKDADGNIAIKVMLVPHHIGYVRMTAEIPKCKE